MTFSFNFPFVFELSFYVQSYISLGNISLPRLWPWLECTSFIFALLIFFFLNF